jgi:hypothetical protein
VREPRWISRAGSELQPNFNPVWKLTILGLLLFFPRWVDKRIAASAPPASRSGSGSALIQAIGLSGDIKAVISINSAFFQVSRRAWNQSRLGVHQ